MTSRFTQRASAALLAAILLLAVPLGASAAGATQTGTANNVTLTVTGANAVALAACVNLAKEGNYSRLAQTNVCHNFAQAEGGDVRLKNVKILQAGVGGAGTTSQSNAVTITLTGGDATALAACLNIAKQGKNSSADQSNKCKNKAIAEGGDVVLKNVKISQVNVAGGTTTSQSNAVTITLTGGDATALAACLNIAQQGNASTVDQSNDCKNSAVAEGGDVVLKNVRILQVNVGGSSTTSQSNTVTITLNGGDAITLAGCLNEVKEGKHGSASQANRCSTKVTASAGDVTLKNVRIIQVNIPGDAAV
jgi:hypothetical protein